MAGFTEDQLTVLEAAIADGTLIVKYSDKMIEYRSLDEMLRMRELMRRELGQTPRTRRVFAKYNKGMD